MFLIFQCVSLSLRAVKLRNTLLCPKIRSCLLCAGKIVTVLESETGYSLGVSMILDLRRCLTFLANPQERKVILSSSRRYVHRCFCAVTMS